MRFLPPAGAVLFVPAAALAVPLEVPVLGESTVDVATTTQVEYHGSNHDSNLCNDDYLIEILRWNVTGASGETTVGLRLDGEFFHGEDAAVTVVDPPNVFDPTTGDLIREIPPGPCGSDAYLGRPPPDGLLEENDLWPERFWVTTRWGPVRPTAGDFTARFGEGMALSLRKIDETGVDQTIRGARVDVETEGGTRVIALGGWTNIQNLAPVDQSLLEDPEDLVAGLRAEHTLESGLTFGAHYVAYDYLRATGGRSTPDGFRLNDQGAHVAGAGLRAPAIGGVLDVAVEADYSESTVLAGDSGLEAWQPAFLMVEEEGRVDKTQGWALYASTTWNFEDTTVLVEAKDYRNFRFVDPTRVYIQYSEPPTLERIDQLILNNYNVAAMRVRLEQRFDSGHTTFFTNWLGGAFVNDDADPVDAIFGGEVRDRRGDVVEPFTVSHAYGGMERRWDDGTFVVVQTGVREESLRDPAPGANGTFTDFHHVDLDFGLPLGGPHALELKAWTWGIPRVSTIVKSGHEYRRSSASLSYSIAPHWAFAVIYGFTSEKAEQIQPRHYWSSSVSWTANDHLTLRAFGGRRMGGLLCVGGVCRDYPPFEGAQLAALFTY